MRVGIICEGTTDYEVLTVIVKETISPLVPTFALLQPDGDRLMAPAAGPVLSDLPELERFIGKISRRKHELGRPARSG